MREILKEILEKYPNARATTVFGGQHEIRSLFENLKDEFSALDFVRDNKNLIVKYSYGKGNWAETPWIAILDKRETITTTKGTYVVILFRSDGDGCHLKLGQGVTEIKELYGSGASAVEELQRRADQVRAMFPSMVNSEFDQAPQLSNDRRAWRTGLTGLYEASTIYSKYYRQNEIPSNESLSKDIGTLVDCYEKYVLEDKSNEDLSESPNRKIWAIGLGERGRLWNESYEKGIISIGWDYLGDLSQYNSQDEVMVKLVELRGPDAQSPTNDSLCCYQFAHEINVGDLVIAKVGRKKILGGGIVTSNYVYDPERREHKNIRQVKWVTTEEAELPGTGGPVKTLTEISRYPTFRELVEAYVSEKTIPEKVVAEPYSYSDALKDLFLNEAD